jgi:hypothetical protein
VYKVVETPQLCRNVWKLMFCHSVLFLVRVLTVKQTQRQ